MRLIFEAVNFRDLVHQLEETLSGIRNKPEPEKLRPTPVPAVDVAAVEKKLSEPWPKPVEKAVEKAVEKSGDKRVRTERQLANDERLRAAAQAKKAAGIKPFTKSPPKADPPPVPEPVEEPEVFADPAEVVRIRQKTITDLQEAYANGHQQEVFELLSRFGNGAKSFRELPPEAFRPIRDAIDKGALT